MVKRNGLGKGLDALIPQGFQPINQSPEARSEDGLLYIEVNRIVPNPLQPRSIFDKDQLTELAASIKEHGVIQPLLVNSAQNGKYTLIAGERRWQASQLAGIATVPVVVRQSTEQQMLELALIENIQRADLNPLEEANAYRHLSDDFNLSHEEIASRVGKSRVAVTNTMRLLNLPMTVQNSLTMGEISEGHARALLGLVNPKAIESALRTVIAKRLTVRQTEELVGLLKGMQKEKKLAPTTSAEEKSLLSFLRDSMNHKVNVKISPDRAAGSMTIYFGSEEEFQDLIIKLTGKEYHP
ncbi:MAG TPA: ParB/RepB/Spo0J family partition protein [Anaerolineales bacterium]|nr:ParB/RepB/Spo0J family partition protein [Anaerolineales bacterium]